MRICLIIHAFPFKHLVSHQDQIVQMRLCPFLRCLCRIFLTFGIHLLCLIHCHCVIHLVCGTWHLRCHIGNHCVPDFQLHPLVFFTVTVGQHMKTKDFICNPSLHLAAFPVHKSHAPCSKTPHPSNCYTNTKYTTNQILCPDFISQQIP